MHDHSIYSNGTNTWAIDVIKQEAEGLPARPTAIASMTELETVEWLLKCFQQVQSCDTEQPVILGPDGQLLFGNCQVVRARLEGRTHVPAIRLSFMPEPVTSIENLKPSR